MREDTMQATVAFAFNTWLDQHDAQAEADNTPNEISQQCGAWLLLRRAELGLTQAMIYERTGLEPWQLTMLEAGLAGPDTLPKQALFRLCLVLEGIKRDLQWVTAVMHLALGHTSDGSEWVNERVAAELEATYLAAAENDKMPSIPELTEDQFYVLAAYAQGPMDEIGVRSAISERWGKTTKLELPTIWAVTQELLARNMLVAMGEPSGLLSYQLSEPLGVETLQIEEKMFAVREHERQLSEQRRQLEKQRRDLWKQRAWWRRVVAGSNP
ncbi:MAG TPA: hypothetical protein PKK78_19710 [Kouleothrix sp.]|nr:hypothetical protein [Kouleothrix sp.]